MVTANCGADASRSAVCVVKIRSSLCRYVLISKYVVLSALAADICRFRFEPLTRRTFNLFIL
jgi:hypothetical protein